MSIRRDPDDTLRLWLEEGPNDLPRETARAIDVATRSAPQRRRALLPWSPSPTPLAKRLLAAAAVVAVLVVGVVALLRPVPNLGGVGGAPSPSASPSPLLPPIDTSDWVTYGSSVYGFSIAHPPDWDVSPAVGPWDPDVDSRDFDRASDRWESFESNKAPDPDLIVSVWSAVVDPGTTLEEWILASCDEGGSTPCGLAMDRARPVLTDSGGRREGLLVPFQADTQVFFRDGDRIYVVAAWRNEAQVEAGRIVEAFAKTLCLGTPEDPCEGVLVPSAVPSAVASMEPSAVASVEPSAVASAEASMEPSP